MTFSFFYRFLDGAIFNKMSLFTTVIAQLMMWPSLFRPIDSRSCMVFGHTPVCDISHDVCYDSHLDLVVDHVGRTYLNE
jgi:hypothetical protein